MNHPDQADEHDLDCRGCGVCCFHMGYPAFVLPADPKTEQQIAADPELSKLAKDPRTKQHLLNGIPGEEYWHRLPDHLKSELQAFIAHYSINEGELDGPCFWLDPETRLCKHHEYRPSVCRDFEVGSRGCLEWRVHYREQIVQLK